MTDLEARLNAATPGEWFHENRQVMNATRSYTVCMFGDSMQDYHDAEFIAHAPEDIRELRYALTVLREELETTRIENMKLRDAAKRANASARRRGETVTKENDIKSNIDDTDPEDTCQRCGGANFSWFVDSDRFNTAVNSGEIICPSCFVAAHEAAIGMHCSWSLMPGTPFRWIDDDGRPTPYVFASTQEEGQ